jgi:predicted DNA-binding transcriptional regulator AlpA
MPVLFSQRWRNEPPRGRAPREGNVAENAIASVAPTPLLLDARAAARLCGVSVRTWWALHSAGKTPLPVRLGRRTLWLADELSSWARAGAPARDKWENVKKAVRP